MPNVVSRRTVTASDTPTHAEMVATLGGEDTGWTFTCQVPPVCHVNWFDSDWIKWIGDGWRRKPIFNEAIPF